jgi:hypothetical protein
LNCLHPIFTPSSSRALLTRPSQATHNLPSSHPVSSTPFVHAHMIPHYLCVTTPGILVQPPNSSQFRHECINLSSHMCSCHHRRFHSLADQTLIHHFLVTFSSPIFKPTSLPRTTRPHKQPTAFTPLHRNPSRSHGSHINLTLHNYRTKNLNSTCSQFGHKNVSTQAAIFAHSITGHITC